jgi:hypothetical protein
MPATATLGEGGFNFFYVDGNVYPRFGTTVHLEEMGGKLSIATIGDGILFDDVYGNIYLDGSPFPTFQAMADWVDVNVIFKGQNLTKDAVTGIFFVNGKPYRKGELYRAWDDVTQSLELRHGHNDLSDKPMPMTPYSQIVVDDTDNALVGYTDLIKWIYQNAV